MSLYRLPKYQLYLDSNDKKTSLWINSNEGIKYKNKIIRQFRTGIIKIPHYIIHKVLNIDYERINKNDYSNFERQKIEEIILSLYFFRGGMNVNDINKLDIEISGLFWEILNEYKLPTKFNKIIEFGEILNRDHNLGKNLSDILSWYIGDKNFKKSLQNYNTKRNYIISFNFRLLVRKYIILLKENRIHVEKKNTISKIFLELKKLDNFIVIHLLNFL